MDGRSQKTSLNSLNSIKSVPFFITQRQSQQEIRHRHYLIPFGLIRRLQRIIQPYTDMLDLSLSHPEQWVWYTAWGLYQNDSGDWVGDLCFKGLPENGQPEIGYGLLPEYEHQGYATEAVRAACRWAFEQPGVTAVEAETDPGNTASQAVLHRVGFVPTGTVGAEGPRFILRQKP